MLHLALNYRSTVPVRIKSIADAHGIPQRFLVQILLQLKTAGLVASIRGAAGGYQLVRSPDKVSVADIISAVMDRTSATPHQPIASLSSAVVQAVRSIWHELQVEEQRILEELSLGELARRAQESSGLSYQI
jgi:Rrf2 family protein